MFKFLYYCTCIKKKKFFKNALDKNVMEKSVLGKREQDFMLPSIFLVKLNTKEDTSLKLSLYFELLNNKLKTNLVCKQTKP